MTILFERTNEFFSDGTSITRKISWFGFIAIFAFPVKNGIISFETC